MKLNEIAGARKSVVKYYHGTSDEETGLKILKSRRLRPGNNDGIDANNFTPLKNRTYFTSNIGYAQIYAIGGDLAGSTYHPDKHGQYGYVFELSNINSMLPDEDKVGEIIRDLIDDHHNAFDNVDSDIIDEIDNEVRDLLDNDVTYTDENGEEVTESYTEFEAFIDGEEEYFAKVGKHLLNNVLSDEVINILLDHVDQFSARGELQFSTAWKINKELIPMLKRDGSNFFKYANKIKL